MRKLPQFIVVAPGQAFDVFECPLGGELGAVDYSREEVLIESDQPEAGKYLALLHELVHIALQKSEECGVIQPALCEGSGYEDFVGSISASLFFMLGLSGLLDGIDPQEVEEFIDEAEEIDRRRSVVLQS